LSTTSHLHCQVRQKRPSPLPSTSQRAWIFQWKTPRTLHQTRPVWRKSTSSAHSPARRTPKVSPNGTSVTSDLVLSPEPQGKPTCNILLTLLVFLQPTIRTNDPHALPDAWNLRIPRRRRQPHALDRHHRRPNRNPLLRPHAQALLLLPSKLPLLAAHRPLQNAHLPPQHRLQRPDLSGHPKRQVECRIQRAERFVEPTESAGGAK
jgi:hypothetical protein